MQTAILIALFFLVAGVSDWLSVHWQWAREAGKTSMVMGLSVLLEGVGWIPIVIAIDTDAMSASTIALASIAGASVGAGIAMRRKQWTKTNGSEDP